MITRPALVVLLSAALSCTGSEDARHDTPDPVVFDSAGVAITINAGPLAPVDVSSEPEVVIGHDDAQDYFLYRATHAERLTDAIVIANAGTQELLFFTPEGALLRSVGGEGRGPGEFGNLGPMRRLEHDALAVSDGGNRRITVFDSVGTVVAMVPYTPVTGDAPQGSVCASGITLGLIAIDVPVTTGPLCFDATRSGPTSQRASYYVGTGDSVQVIGTFDLLRLHWRPGETMPMVFPPFASPAVQEIAGGLFLYSAGDEREYELYDTSGRLVQVVRDGAPRVEVPAALRDSVERAQATAGGVVVPAPEYFPSWDRAVLDDEQRVWLREYPSPRQAREVWTGYDRTGRRVMSVRFPPRFALASLDAGRALGFATDSLDVQTFMTLRLPAAPR